jgi:hypothetical protein
MICRICSSHFNGCYVCMYIDILLPCSAQSTSAHPLSHTYTDSTTKLTYREYRAVSGVFRTTVLTPHPLSTQRVCPPPAPQAGGGGYTLHTRQAVKGVNISKDARHWIRLLQYTPSTDSIFHVHPSQPPPTYIYQLIFKGTFLVYFLNIFCGLQCVNTTTFACVEGCLDSNPESCRTKRARYQLVRR